jgi:hypothetical protein
MNTTQFFTENSSKQNRTLQCSHPLLPQHTKIEDKLNYFLLNNKIPNIIFNGSSGTGKKTIVYEFINKIYNYDKSKIKTNVLFVNCSHGKGIKFIREELKFFAKSNIQSNSGVLFKTIVLMNADHLTTDAQSALRRCIELFSYNTRFFIIVENKNKLLNPILSRFCEIYVPEYSNHENMEEVSYKVLNLHQHHLNHSIDLNDVELEKMELIREHLSPFHNINGNMENIHCSLLDVCNIFYEHGICGLDIVHFVENAGWWTEKDIIHYNVTFYNIKSEYRCEKLLMFYILDLIFVSIS